MAKITLDVPTLAQEKSMCCWHTSSMMIWQYWQQQTGRQGPMNTLAPTYVANTGLGVSELITLAKKVGMKELPNKSNYSSDDLFKLITDHGPLWAAGDWYGAGHAIVITGIDGAIVYLNDPDQGKKKTESLEWFNKHLYKSLTGSLMHKDPSAY